MSRRSRDARPGAGETGTGAGFALAEWVRARAAYVFRHDPGPVTLRWGGDCERLGALALAAGDEVHLDPRVLLMDERERLGVVGHELAHVVQQREGRVRRTAMLAGRPLNDDPSLEREADRWAASFVAGRPLPRRRLAAVPRPEPVVQRTVAIGDKPLFDQEHLPEKIGDILTLIDGAETWLDWAIRDPETEFRFEGYDEFVQNVQLGLHASPVILLRHLQLWVSPSKLASMSTRDLNAILHGDQGNGSSHLMTRVNAILCAEGLRTAKELESVASFLEQLGSSVASDPLFSSPSLGDLVALLRLNDELAPSTGSKKVRRAAQWAVAVAASPAEFADLVLFALRVEEAREATASAEDAGDGDAKDEDVQDVWARLMPLVQTYSRCPVVSIYSDPVQVYAAASRWLGSGFRLGFRTAASGLSQIVAHAGVLGDDEPAAAIERYISQAEELVLGGAPSAGRVSQDGTLRYFDFEDRRGRGQLVVNGRGCVTLSEYHHKSRRGARE